MKAVSQQTIERFMQGQVAAWNAHDKAGLLALYREVAAEGLSIEYVGRTDQADGWFVIKEMYDKHNSTVRLEPVLTIINGNEAAVHHRNCVRGTDVVIESIETYRFEPGRLSVRYFLKAPDNSTVDLSQFRGFAAETAEATR